MKRLIFAVLLLICSIAPARADDLTADDLVRRTIERRAIEALNWGMPAVNFDRMLQAMIATGGAPNRIVYWSRLPSWKNQTLTPNPDVIYVMPFFNTKDAGPVVLEIPPAGPEGSITGTIMDSWQSALEDVGPAGFDKGKGGKYLILPPDMRLKATADYIPLSPLTFQGYALLRSILKSGSDADVAKAVAYARRIKVYPLSEAAHPPAAKFIDAVDIVFDATIPYDIRFFQSLNRIIQTEPWLERDKAMIDLLKTIGIEKGKPFNPDQTAQGRLSRAASEAHAWLNLRYDSGFPSFFDGTHWAFPASPDVAKTASTFYEAQNAYSVDGRGLADYYAFSTVKHLGAGQFYLMTTKDGAGQPLDGKNSYRLHVPADAPVKQYWSAVVYDRATHALVRDVSRASRSSQSPGLRQNADGSVDIYFAPAAPAGMESNWIPTSTSSGFEVMFRLYGPDKSFFEKKWQLPDIEKLG